MMWPEKSSYMMPSSPPVATRIFLITARLARSNIVTVESPPLVMKPWCDLGTSAMPWVRGVSGISPNTFPVAPSTTITCVPRDTNTRPVPGSGRVFVSRGTHVMVVDGATGKVLGDIPDTPRTHGIALVPRSHHGFTTNGGDSTVTMFDLASLAVIKKIPVARGGLDGIMFDDFSGHIILTNHSHPSGTVVALDPASGDIVGTVELEDDSPEGAASDGKGRIFVNNEGKSTIQVIDDRKLAVLASWPLAPCEGPTDR